jgi:hypothetical protein
VLQSRARAGAVRERDRSQLLADSPWVKKVHLDKVRDLTLFERLGSWHQFGVGDRRGGLVRCLERFRLWSMPTPGPVSVPWWCDGRVLCRCTTCSSRASASSEQALNRGAGPGTIKRASLPPPEHWLFRREMSYSNQIEIHQSAIRTWYQGALRSMLSPGANASSACRWQKHWNVPGHDSQEVTFHRQ